MPWASLNKKDWCSNWIEFSKVQVATKLSLLHCHQHCKWLSQVRWEWLVFAMTKKLFCNSDFQMGTAHDTKLELQTSVFASQLPHEEFVWCRQIPHDFFFFFGNQSLNKNHWSFHNRVHFLWFFLGFKAFRHLDLKLDNYIILKKHQHFHYINPHSRPKIDMFFINF